MAGFNDTGYASFTPLETIRLHAAVTLDAGGVRTCQEGETPIGQACRNGVAPGEPAHEKISVALRNKQGTHIVTASDQIGEGVEITTDNDGKYRAAVVGTDPVFGVIRELGGATADDHEVEAIFY